MAVNARTEEFQHIEVFDKPALFTNGRIARDTVPKGWYCYDIRGSDDDPGELCYMEENVVVNHAGSVLMPEKLAMPKSGRLDVRDELGFLDEGNMTLREFCEAHQLPYPAENMKFHIRPARPEYGLPCDTRFGCNFQYHPLRRMTCSKRTLWCKTPILTQFYVSVGWSY